MAVLNYLIWSWSWWERDDTPEKRKPEESLVKGLCTKIWAGVGNSKITHSDR